MNNETEIVRGDVELYKGGLNNNTETPNISEIAGEIRRKNRGEEILEPADVANSDLEEIVELMVKHQKIDFSSLEKNTSLNPEEKNLVKLALQKQEEFFMLQAQYVAETGTFPPRLSHALQKIKEGQPLDMSRSRTPLTAEQAQQLNDFQSEIKEKLDSVRPEPEEDDFPLDIETSLGERISQLTTKQLKLTKSKLERLLTESTYLDNPEELQDQSQKLIERKKLLASAATVLYLSTQECDFLKIILEMARKMKNQLPHGSEAKQLPE